MTKQEPKNFAELSENVAEVFNSATHEISLALAEVATALHERASAGADMVVDAEREQAKRENIKLWRETAAYFDALADAVNKTPVSADGLRDELAGMLLHGVECIFRNSTAAVLDRDSIESLMRERANNIAQVYAGRVMPELSFGTRRS